LSKTGSQVYVINSLRAIAALMVCVFHFTHHKDEAGIFMAEGTWVKYCCYLGHHGVNVFFVISGFVIPYSMYQSRYEWTNAGKFVTKRLIRLHPPFVLSMLLYAIMELLYWAKGGYQITYDWPRIGHNFLLTARFFDNDWFQDVYWTLAIEFQYYIFIALAFPLLFGARKWLSYLLLILIPLTTCLLGYDEKHIFFFHAPVFAIGIGAFLLKIGRINHLQFLCYIVFNAILSFNEISEEGAFFALITALVIVYAEFRNRFAEWVGGISYSLYLTHGFAGCQLMYYAGRYCEGPLQKVLMLIAAALISIFFAWIFAKVIEVPSMRWSQMIKYKKRELPRGDHQSP
jgi:peptidoglycan/LPS O-acetylase OafA/YrhL